MTISAVRWENGLAQVDFMVNTVCPVTIVITSNFGFRWSRDCSASLCQGGIADVPPAAARPTGVTYYLSVMDATGQSRTLASVKGTPFGLPSTPPVSTPRGNATG
jgi:hypothetical protein